MTNFAIREYDVHRNPKNPKDQKRLAKGEVTDIMSRYLREFFSSWMIRFVFALGIVSLIYTIAYFDGVKTVLAVLGGAIFFAIAEYFSHWLVLHKFPKFMPALHQGHAKHHEYPEEYQYLFSPVHYDVMLYAGYFIVLWAVFRDLPLVAAIIAGTSLYQVYYQWMHYASHRPITLKTPWGRWMKKKHLLHHYRDEHSWYGVSHPALDYLFGTHKPRPARVSGQKAESSRAARG